MSEHLSPLQLDEVAAGLTPRPPHVESCATCRAKLEALERQNAAFLARPEAKAQVERLAPPSRRGFLRLVAVAVPLAAGLALFFAIPRDDGTRLKGAAEVVLLDASGQAVTRASPGQKLTLAVGSGGAARAKISAIDAQGNREVLFDGPIAAGARVPLIELEVTPGDVTLEAEFEGGATATMRLDVP